jgi:hypothetical protein
MDKEVVSCVCGPHIYNFILYVYIVYGRNSLFLSSAKVEKELKDDMCLNSIK